MQNLPEVLKAKDVAEYLGVSQRFAYELMSRSDFPTIRFGGKSVRVERSDFLEWVKKKKVS